MSISESKRLNLLLLSLKGEIRLISSLVLCMATTNPPAKTYCLSFKPVRFYNKKDAFRDSSLIII